MPLSSLNIFPLKPTCCWGVGYMFLNFATVQLTLVLEPCKGWIFFCLIEWVTTIKTTTQVQSLGVWVWQTWLLQLAAFRHVGKKWAAARSKPVWFVGARRSTSASSTRAYHFQQEFNTNSQPLLSLTDHFTFQSRPYVPYLTSGFPHAFQLISYFYICLRPELA